MSSNFNYNGKQYGNNQFVKQFTDNMYNNITWIYKNLSLGNKVITPSDKNVNVLINKDLLVMGSINNPSDINIKNNIVPINNDIIESVSKLNPVEFRYNTDSQHKKHYGLIAQELELIYPELVSNNLSDIKSVNYIELIPILLAKMQQMQIEIDQLKKKI